MKKIIAIVIVSLMSFFLCGFTVNFLPIPTLPGHELITKFAIEDANIILGEKFYPEINLDDVKNPIKSNNPLILGVYATDRPNDVEFGKILLSDYQISPGDDWHSGLDIQDIHFLRNFLSDDVPVSRYEASKAGKERIISASIKANQLWKEALQISDESLKEKAFLYIGHASHIIQDAFSQAHTIRSDDFKLLKDICTYVKEVNGICYHSIILNSSNILDDIIFNETTSIGLDCKSGLFGFPESRKCLKPEALKAVDTTTSYLVTVAKFLKSGETSSKFLIPLNEYFENSSTPGSGYFSSNDLDGSPKAPPPQLIRSFSSWCNDTSAPNDAKHTVSRIMDVYGGGLSCQDTENLLLTWNYLGLSDEQITNLQPIASFKNFEEISLSNNNITDLTPLSNLTELKKIYLQNNKNLRDISPLMAIQNLESIDLSGTNIKNLYPLESLKKITDLFLGENQIRNISDLEWLPQNLIYLDLSKNQIYDTSPLSVLENLQYLVLSKNNVVNLKPLSELTKLKSLNLDNNPLLSQVCPVPDPKKDICKF